MRYPVLVTPDSVIIIKGGKRLIAHKNHANYNKIVDCIRKDSYTNIERLFDVKTRIEKCFGVTIHNNCVFYKNKQLHGVVVDKILSFMNLGLPHRPLLKFLDKLMQNPNDYCRDQLYKYIEKYGLAIDEDGMVISWKAVRSDFFDKYSGTVNWRPGKTHKMKLEDCEQNHLVGCAKSYHTGAASYVLSYGSGDDRFVMTKFNPKHVVSCPADCDWQKLRVCQLTSVKEVKREDLRSISGVIDNVKMDTKRNYLNQNRDSNGRFVKA